jgi:ornithine cyclodeaminase/alanine dehydrogenase-like protein (mu-crystallin family)
MILGADDVRALLTWDALIPAMERALADYSAGRAVQPVRTVIPAAGHGGFLFVMPALAGGALGAKLVTYFPKNEGVETHHAVIQLFRSDTGEPLATIDGTLITEMRTAAVSAVATRLLAREDAHVLALLGAGVQARSHLAALQEVRAFDDIRVWSPRSARAFAERHAAEGVRAATSAEEAVRAADVVVVATTSPTPVLHGAWVKPGAHVNAVGAARPEWRELDDEFVQRATMFVDSREGAFKESGDVIAAGRAEAEIGEVVLGRHGGRASRDEITCFKSLGMAVEDMGAAELVWKAAGGR